MVDYLIESGANIQSSNSYGNTCLMAAASFNNIHAVNALIKSGADLNAQAKCGATALHYAAKEGIWQIFEKLLKSDSIQYKLNNAGSSPLKFAAANVTDECFRKMVEILRQAHFLTKQDALDSSFLFGCLTIMKTLCRTPFILMNVPDVTRFFKAAFFAYFDVVNWLNVSNGEECDSPITWTNYEHVDIASDTFLSPDLNSFNQVLGIDLSDYNQLETNLEHPSIFVSTLTSLIERYGGSEWTIMERCYQASSSLFIRLNQYDLAFQNIFKLIRLKMELRLCVEYEFERVCLMMRFTLRQRVFDVDNWSFADEFINVFQLGKEYFTLVFRSFGYHELNDLNLKTVFPEWRNKLRVEFSTEV